MRSICKMWVKCSGSVFMFTWVDVCASQNVSTERPSVLCIFMGQSRQKPLWQRSCREINQPVEERQNNCPPSTPRSQLTKVSEASTSKNMIIKYTKGEDLNHYSKEGSRHPLTAITWIALLKWRTIVWSHWVIRAQLWPTSDSEMIQVSLILSKQPQDQKQPLPYPTEVRQE